MAKINVLSREVSIQSHHQEDYICLTDIARYKDADRTDDLIRNWLRNRNTIEFLGIWEQLNNPHFKPVEFDGFRIQAGLNSFTLTPKQWIEKTAARGIISKSGRYGGTYAHKDIAFEFASWISVEFKLYLIKEFQRLKEDERLTQDWDIRRNLAKINYHIHTDAIKNNLIPDAITKDQANSIYASEADVLNVALFGITAKQWRDSHPNLDGNIRDHANGAQLVCLSNLESLNANSLNLVYRQKIVYVNLTSLPLLKCKSSLNTLNINNLNHYKQSLFRIPVALLRWISLHPAPNSFEIRAHTIIWGCPP